MFRCYVEGCDVVNNSTGLVDEFTPSWLNNTLPGWGRPSATDANRLERECYRYSRNWTSIDQCLTGDEFINATNVEKCNRWVFDTTNFRSTVFTEVFNYYTNTVLNNVPISFNI